MAKDLIGEIGLDVEEINKALGLINANLDKLTGHVAKADKAIKGGLTASLKDAARALGVAFGAASVARYIASLRNLSTEIDTMRSHMLDSGRDTTDGGPAIMFKRAGLAVDKFQVKAKLAVAQSIQGLRMAGEAAGNWWSNFVGIPGTTHDVSDQNARDSKTDQLKKEILQDDTRIAQIQSHTLSTQQDRLALLEEELALQQKRLALIQREPSQFDNPDQARIAALNAIGALKAEREATAYATERELRLAKATTQEMELQLKGMSGAAKATQVRAKYEQQILQAQRDGKTALAAQLQKQQNIALGQIAVAEHNMTPAQRRAERTAARKFSRDSQKTLLHNQDLEKRLNQAEADGHSITPGSELDRYRSRRDAKRAANGRNAIDNGKGIDAQLANTFNKDGLAALKSIDGKVDGLTKLR